MVTALRAHAKNFARAMRAALKPHIHKFAKQEEEHHDAKDDSAGDVAKHLRQVAKRERDSSGQLPKVTKIASKRVVEHSEKEFDRLGIDITEGEPELAAGIEAWREEILSRIADMENYEIDRIETILREGSGRRFESLQADIEEQLEDITESRAEFIARDATLKLNARVTRERQQAAAIEQYVWTTSGDERVRESHDELDGETFSWDDPPIMNDDGDVGHPGDDYQCRCTAFPVLPELDDDDKGDEEDDSE